VATFGINKKMSTAITSEFLFLNVNSKPCWSI